MVSWDIIAQLDYISRTDDIDRVQGRPLVSRNRDIAGAMVHDLGTLKGPFQGSQVTDVPANGPDNQARQRTVIAMHQGPHVSPTGLERPHKIAPQMTRCACHDDHHRSPSMTSISTGARTAGRWGLAMSTA